MRRLLAAGLLALLLVPALARPASAHPLGNYTVNRAVAVTIAPDHVALLYLVDMAEIPAFSEIGVIDSNADGSVSTQEGADYAKAACARVLHNLELGVDTTPLSLSVASEPELDLLPGAGGLRTLRLACHFSAPSAAGGSVAVVDHTDDGHVGWREVTIAAADGVRIVDTDVPDRSDSDYLRAYPSGRLESSSRRAPGSCVVPDGRWRASQSSPDRTERTGRAIRGQPIRWPRCWRGTSRRRSWCWRSSSPPASVLHTPSRRDMARRWSRPTWSARVARCARPSPWA